MGFNSGFKGLKSEFVRRHKKWGWNEFCCNKTQQDATISFIHLSLLLLISSFHLVVFLCDFFLPLALSFVILYPSFLTFFLTSFVAKLYYSFLLTPFLNFTYSFLISKFSEFVLFCSPYLYISFPSYILLYSILLTSLPLHHSSLRLHVTCKQKLVSIFWIHAFLLPLLVYLFSFLHSSLLHLTYFFTFAPLFAAFTRHL